MKCEAARVVRAWRDIADGSVMVVSSVRASPQDGAAVIIMADTIPFTIDRHATMGITANVNLGGEAGPCIRLRSGTNKSEASDQER